MIENFDEELKNYVSEINRIKLLTKEEEIQIGKTIKESHHDIIINKAKQQLINSNLKLVISIAKSYLNKGLSFMDLIQEGNIGLIKAVDLFDIDKCCKFSTYATYWIKNKIERALIQQPYLIKIPFGISAETKKYNRIRNHLYIKYGEEPTDEEVSIKSGISLLHIKRIKELYNKCHILSLDYSTDESETNYMDNYTISEDSTQSTLITNKIKNETNKILQELNIKDRYIIKQYYGMDNNSTPKTCQELAMEFNITYEGMRQKIRSIVYKLKKIAHKNNMEELIYD